MADDHASQTSLEQPNSTTPLLLSTRSSLASLDELARDRPLTPFDTIVPANEWWRSCCSTCSWECENIKQLCNGSRWINKIQAFWYCIWCPISVFYRAISSSREQFRPSGIVYLYVLLSCTVVFNLVELRMTNNSNSDEGPAQHVRQGFVMTCMTLAIVGMSYIFCNFFVLHGRGNIQFHTAHSILMRVFFQAGLYIFGFGSMGYSVCKAINEFHSRCYVAATLQVIIALYIVLQTLFLNRFYQARISSNALLIHIAFAHLLGTNLALWFWILCTEIANRASCQKWNSKPIHLDHSEKYFYPFYVEYLLLAASMLYPIWQNLHTPESPHGQPHCSSCIYRIVSDNQRPTEPNEVMNRRETTRGRRYRRYIPNSGYGIVLGLCFAMLFLVLVLVSNDSGEDDETYYIAYSGGTTTLYASQIVACYIVLLSLQSQRRNRELKSFDHDDALLGFALAGIVLWEGFHIFSLLLKGNAEVIEIITDFFGIAQQLIQTVTLVRMRRYKSTNDSNSTWICECALFLLTTNLAFWAENSFFLDTAIKRPGENVADLEDPLKPLSYILKPLTIFFRFHSATCFFHAWSIFRAVR